MEVREAGANEQPNTQPRAKNKRSNRQKQDSPEQQEEILPVVKIDPEKAFSPREEEDFTPVGPVLDTIREEGVHVEQALANLGDWKPEVFI